MNRIKQLVVLGLAICIISGCEKVEQETYSQSRGTESLALVEDEDVALAGKNDSKNANDISESDSIDLIAKNLYKDYYPVFFQFDYASNLILFKDKKLSVYIDDEKITTMEQNESKTFGLILSTGEHTLKVSSSVINSKSQKFYVEGINLLEELPIIYFSEIGYKNGDATIIKIKGIDDNKYADIVSKTIDYESCLAVVIANYKPIGEFDAVVERYDKVNNKDNDKVNNKNEEKINSTKNEPKYEEAEPDEQDDYYVYEDESYILPNSSSEYLTVDDICWLDKEQLRLARNEIYARHGRMFNATDLQSYFDSCSWYVGCYTADNFDESVLNDYERANANLISDYEVQMGYK